ncbi:hypothetical protein bsdtb5_37540 [Anaeromicropila herbilytica]|uniref:Peptidase M14 domain-containing protein n=2 Tax=Anaeromicropila herbilytica TaxID=2785025 RepID=A0A7R7EPD0_9FIRM|nr:hypothetical protein bsdtb5_37540 [Anaeromicropila herbilytica]
MHLKHRRRKKKYLPIILLLCMLSIMYSQKRTILAAEVTDSTGAIGGEQNPEETSSPEGAGTNTNIGANTTITLNETEFSVGVGETYNIMPVLTPTDSKDIVSYSSEDSSIATVNEGGTITANREGTVNITVSLANGNKAECKVHVIQAPEDISIGVDTKTLKKGSTYSLNPEITNGYMKSGFSYQSNNSKVAEVNASGIITAKSNGNADIMIGTYNGLEEKVHIRVVDKIASLDIQYIPGKQLMLAKGQSRTIFYQVSPKSQSSYVKKNIYYSSSDPKIVSIDKNGKITAKSVGNATITLLTKDGSAKKLSMDIIVVGRKSGTSYSENNLSIVNQKDSRYSYSDMVTDLNIFKKKYGDCLKVSVLSKTYDNRNIYEVILGNPNAKKKVMVQSSIHAREYMTALLTMKQIEFYCKNYYTGRYAGKYFNELFEDVAFYIVPMANPDGVSISQYGAAGVKNKALRNRVKAICRNHGGGTSYYHTWKANVRGVDLNRNFDQYWSILEGSPKGMAGFGYKGPSAASEKETKTLMNLFQDISPVASISYHATGSIIYWDYGQKGAFRNECAKLMRVARSLTSYKLVKGFSKYHATGFSDWVAINQRTPAITIEIGRGSCPLSRWEFSSIWSKNKLMYLKTADLYN